MRVSIIIIVAVAMLTGVAACSSSVSVDYYQLNTINSVAVTKQNAESIFLQPVQVASYLNSKSIIMQMSPVQLVLARQHLWAEPLDQQIQRKLAKALEATDQNYAITLKPNSDAITLMVSVEQFHGTTDGYAVLTGRYSVLPAYNNAPTNRNNLQNYTFSYQLPLQSDGYPALVLSLSQAVEKLAEDILQQLTKTTSS